MLNKLKRELIIYFTILGALFVFAGAAKGAEFIDPAEVGIVLDVDKYNESFDVITGWYKDKDFCRTKYQYNSATAGLTGCNVLVQRKAQLKLEKLGFSQAAVAACTGAYADSATCWGAIVAESDVGFTK